MSLPSKKIAIKIASIAAVVLLTKIIISATSKDKSKLTSNSKASSSSFATAKNHAEQKNLPSNDFVPMHTLGAANDISNGISSNSKCENSEFTLIQDDSTCDLTELMQYMNKLSYKDNVDIENEDDSSSTSIDVPINTQWHFKPLSQSSALVEDNLYNSSIDISDLIAPLDKHTNKFNILSSQDSSRSFPELITESSNNSITQTLNQVVNTNNIVFDDSSTALLYHKLISQINDNIQNMQQLKLSLTNAYDQKSIRKPILQAEISFCKSNIMHTKFMLRRCTNNKDGIIRFNATLKELQNELRSLQAEQEEAKNNYIYNNSDMYEFQHLHENYRQQFLNLLDQCIILSNVQSYDTLKQIYEFYFD